MNADSLTQRLRDVDDQSNLCVVLRAGESGLEVLLVADELGRWSIPGGHAEEGETREQACQREVREETGLEVEVQPMFAADHVARKRPTAMFYAIATDTDARPGGGDVTKVRWTPVNDLGGLNGTDRLAIAAAANRVHNTEALVTDAVELAESLGYPVANVIAPPEPVHGIHLRLTGAAAADYAQRLAEWSNSLGWPTEVISTELCESTLNAIQRATVARRLTPMLEAVLHVSDALWRYADRVAPLLVEGGTVIETGPVFDSQRLLDREMPQDLLEHMLARVPKPPMLFNVGEAFDPAEFQLIKDALESLHADPDDPAAFVANITKNKPDSPWKMEYVRFNAEDAGDPIVRCPRCKHEGPLMQDFSLLAAGFNGVAQDSLDDADVQECDSCGCKMQWHHIDDDAIKCPHCTAPVMYALEPEIAMGAVACPSCGKTIPHPAPENENTD